VDFAHTKNIKVVMAELLGGLAARSRASHVAQRALIRATQYILPELFTARLAWKSYLTVDAVIANTNSDAALMKNMFKVPSNRIHVVPNGVEPVFFRKRCPGQWLVLTATITKRKRVLETMTAAIQARTPLWIIGSPYSTSDPYFKQFLATQQAHADLIRYEGGIADRDRLAAVYREARGFVLLSTMETRSLSCEEAAASGCPLLLTDLSWARDVFGANAQYVSPTESLDGTARHLRTFYDGAPSLPSPPKPTTWDDVAARLKRIYEDVCHLPLASAMSR
jgi:glycosyltransferase involved in cell wall biosynthesis